MRRLARSATLLLALGLLLGGGVGCSKQVRRARYIARADKDFAAERYERAEIEYLQALSLPPSDPHAVTRLGIISYHQGRWASATVRLNDAVKLDPTNVQARVKLGLSYLVFQELKPAHAQALAALAQEPENPEALLLLAGTITSQQEIPAALEAFARVSPQAQARPGYHVARGSLYLHQLDPTNAETEYRRELALDPKSSQAYLALGNLFLMRQDIKQAEPMLKSAAQLAPLRSGARLAYANLKLQTGGAEEAIADIQDLTKKAPDYLPGWLFLARVAAAQNKPDESAAFVQRVLARDSINLEGLMLSGSLWLAKGDGTNAAIQFERIIKTYSAGYPLAHYNLALASLMTRDVPKAIANLDHAIALNTNYVDAVLLRANLNLRQGNSAAAIASLTRLVEQQPLLARGYLDLATAYLGEKNLEQAAAVYRRMAQVFTNSAEVPFNLGVVLLGQNKTNEGRQAFEQSLALAPGFLPAIERLVEMDLAQGRAAEATDRINRLITQYPKTPMLQLLLARIHLSQAETLLAKAKQARPAGTQLRLGDVPATREELNQAEAALLKAVEISPDYRPAHQALASLYVNSGRQQQALDRLNSLLSRTNDLACLMEKGLIQEQMKDYAGARDSYEEILKTQPDAVVALNNLAFLYSERLSQVNRGYELAAKARQLQPGNASIADTFGWMLYRRGDYTRALGPIAEAADELPDSAEVQYHLGMTHYMLGEEEPARAALQRALLSGKEFLGTNDASAAAEILAMDSAKAQGLERSRLEQRLGELPNDPIALQRLAAIQQRDGQLAPAAQTYERALKCNPNSSQLMFKLAQLYCRMGKQSQRALDLAKEAHNQASGDARVSALLGRLVFQSGEYAWAASLLQEAARALSDDPDVQFDLAWAQYSLGRLPEASAAMQRALGSTPPFAKTEDAQGFLSLTAAADNPAQAEQLAPEAEKTLAADSANVPALMVCATAAERRGDFKQAAQFYERALARYPLFAPAQRQLAILSFSQLQDDQKAYELALKAREAYPRDAQLARTLGILSYRRGEYARCAQFLNAADAKSDGELLCYVGLAQYKLQDAMRSKVTLKQALALNPPSNLAEEAKKALAELK